MADEKYSEPCEQAEDRDGATYYYNKAGDIAGFGYHVPVELALAGKDHGVAAFEWVGLTVGYHDTVDFGTIGSHVDYLIFGGGINIEQCVVAADHVVVKDDVVVGIASDRYAFHYFRVVGF